MARYLGPVCKLCRREGEKLLLKGDRCLTAKCAMERRAYAPGMHAGGRRRKPTDYGIQLREKQKAKRTYGVLERQFRRHFAEAARKAGATGETLLQILETRLDNVVYRLGFADSRSQARQLICHGHFAVNGHKVDIPSYAVKAGDEIAVRDSSKNLDYFKVLAKDISRKAVASWLSLDAQSLSGRVVNLPARNEIDTTLREQLIVEFYSR